MAKQGKINKEKTRPRQQPDHKTQSSSHATKKEKEAAN